MSEAITAAVAAEVRAELGRQNVSGTGLARMMGVSQALVSRRLTGEVPFDVAELSRIAEILGVPVSTFMPAERAA